MELVLKEKCQGDIPQITQCLGFLKDISQRGFLQMKGSQDQQRGVLCVTKKKQEEGDMFWCPDCEAGLCVEGCFKTCHTKLSY
jgi:hypothetical protein